MTPEEAIIELGKRFNGSLCAEKIRWYFSGIDKEKNTYRVTFNFAGNSCESIDGDSFEECFSRIESEQKELNKSIKENEILFKKFD